MRRFKPSQLRFGNKTIINLCDLEIKKIASMNIQSIEFNWDRFMSVNSDPLKVCDRDTHLESRVGIYRNLLQ